MFRPPFCPSGSCIPADPLLPANVPNAWGTTPLLSPGGPTLKYLFGSWIVPLNYKGWPLATQGEQVLITSRQADTDGEVQAGRADPFLPVLP